MPRLAERKEVAADLRGVFESSERRDAKERLKMVAKDERGAPKLAAWLETNAPESLNQEIKRRTLVATLFPNEASLLRLVSAVLLEISEDWETGKTYLTLNTQP